MTDRKSRLGESNPMFNAEFRMQTFVVSSEIEGMPDMFRLPHPSSPVIQEAVSPGGLQSSLGSGRSYQETPRRSPRRRRRHRQSGDNAVAGGARGRIRQQLNRHRDREKAKPSRQFCKTPPVGSTGPIREDARRRAS